jgi:hypothetical protein
MDIMSCCTLFNVCCTYTKCKHFPALRVIMNLTLYMAQENCTTRLFFYHFINNYTILCNLLYLILFLLVLHRIVYIIYNMVKKEVWYNFPVPYPGLKQRRPYHKPVSFNTCIY